MLNESNGISNCISVDKVSNLLNKAEQMVHSLYVKYVNSVEDVNEEDLSDYLWEEMDSIDYVVADYRKVKYDIPIYFMCDAESDSNASCNFDERSPLSLCNGVGYVIVYYSLNESGEFNNKQNMLYTIAHELTHMVQQVNKRRRLFFTHRKHRIGIDGGSLLEPSFCDSARDAYWNNQEEKYADMEDKLSNGIMILSFYIRRLMYFCIRDEQSAFISQYALGDKQNDYLGEFKTTIDDFKYTYEKYNEYCFVLGKEDFYKQAVKSIKADETMRLRRIKLPSTYGRFMKFVLDKWNRVLGKLSAIDRRRMY